MANQNSQSIQVANNVMNLASQMMSLYQQIVVLDASWTDVGAAAVFAAMGTTTLNADGTPGANDGTANAAHPINLGTYPTLKLAVSSNQLAQAKTILDGLVAYVGGSAVTTQAGARAILNAVIGG